MDAFVNTVGLLGVLMMVFAFLMLQTGKLMPQAGLYLWLNLIGALAVMFSLLRFWNLSSFVIECFWAAISVYGLLKRKQPPSLSGES